MCQDIAAVNLLLYEECAGGHGVAAVEGLVHGKSDGGIAAGDMDGDGAVVGRMESQPVVNLAAHDDVFHQLLLREPGFGVNEGSVVAQQVVPLHHGVDAGGRAVEAVHATQGDNGVVVLVCYPGVFFHQLGVGGHAFDAPQSRFVNVGQVKTLAFHGLYFQFGVEHVEKALGQVADAVVDAQHDDECHRADRNADERNPGDDVDDGFLLAGEEVAAGYEEGQVQAGRSFWGLLLQEVLNVLYVVERVVDEEFELRDDAQLLAFAHAEAAAQVGGVFLYDAEDLFFAHSAYGEDAQVDAGYGEVGRDAYACDGDERVAHYGLHFFQEDFAHILLYESGDFVLSCCLHDVKIGLQR